MGMSFAIAIVGRPNVGKSTLFNRLVGRRLALVDDRPGVTRDRREGRARLGDLDFTVIDTAGLEEAAPESLSGRMQEQTGAAIADLYAALCAALPDATAAAADAAPPHAGSAAEGDEAAGAQRPIRIAVVGRPNSGKST